MAIVYTKDKTKIEVVDTDKCEKIIDDMINSMDMKTVDINGRELIYIISTLLGSFGMALEKITTCPTHTEAMKLYAESKNSLGAALLLSSIDMLAHWANIKTNKGIEGEDNNDD